MQSISPYYASKVTELRLQAEGLLTDGRKAPQGPRFFGMRKAGTIKTDATNPKHFDGEAFKAWLDQYVERIKTGTEVSRVDIKALAEQYM